MNELTDAVAANVREFRLRGGFSLSELARRAQISTTTLSALEAGDGNPTVGTVWALAQALDVPVGHLIHREASHDSPQVFRAGEGSALEGETLDVKLLAQPSGFSRLDILSARIKAGSRRKSESHSVGTVEHIYVREGAIRVGPQHNPAELSSGDYAIFRADVPHLYQALTERAEALIVICYPRTLVG